MSAASDGRFRPVDHYENFPVASWLCPPALRRPVAAIYWFARTADDLADEGEADAEQRLADLAAYHQDLLACAAGIDPSPRWRQVFDPLAVVLRHYGLPVPLLSDLLGAFEQDVLKTRDGTGYARRTELLDYCRRSANPIGRLLLHLYGVRELPSLQRSDRICTALQLINFWQDFSRDLPRGRHYLPEEDCARHGLPPRASPQWAGQAAARRLVADEVAWARALMLEGAPLVHTLPGRTGWELRLVVQGGLRILDKIERMGFDTFAARPRLRAWDAPLLLWRALRM